jgi:hypothetical protein
MRLMYPEPPKNPASGANGAGYMNFSACYAPQCSMSNALMADNQ